MYLEDKKTEKSKFAHNDSSCFYFWTGIERLRSLVEDQIESAKGILLVLLGEATIPTPCED